MDLRIFASLRDRDLRREGIVIGEGRLVASRVADRCKLVAVLAERSAAAEAEALAAGRCPFAVLDDRELASVAGYPFHRGLLVAAERPAEVALADAPFMRRPASGTDGGARRLVVLPNPTDQENLGAIARSAAALGWDGLALGPSSCDPYGRRALRCSMAATLTLPLYSAVSADSMDTLRRAGWRTIAAALEEDAAEPGELGPIDRLALLFGNERSGIPAEWRSRCDGAVAIPQGRDEADGVDSLNVAAAAAILLWEGA